MKVYVITKGCYSDYHICAVALDEEKATRLAKLYSGRYDDAEVEEYDTDDPADLLNGRVPYEVYFADDGRTDVVCRVDYYGDFSPGVSSLEPTPWSQWSLSVRLYATDEDTAVKIAAEKRAKYLAEKAGL